MHTDSDPSREFALAATDFVSQALLLMQQLDEDEPPTPAASRALAEAFRASEALARAPQTAASRAAATREAARALQLAACALRDAMPTIKPAHGALRATSMGTSEAFAF
jgi:hypothetical protein